MSVNQWHNGGSTWHSQNLRDRRCQLLQRLEGSVPSTRSPDLKAKWIRRGMSEASLSEKQTSLNWLDFEIGTEAFFRLSLLLPGRAEGLMIRSELPVRTLVMSK